MPRIELALSTASAVAVLLLFSCVAVAYLYYRHTIPPVPIRTRLFLTGLRGLGLFFVVLLIFEPLFRISHTTFEPPVAAILVDNTESMQLRDNIGDRSLALRSSIQSLQDMTLPGKGQQRYFLFGNVLKEHQSLEEDSLILSDDGTDISSALRELSRIKEQQNLRAVVMLTDGAFNNGENPLYAAGELDLPIYTVGIGDSSQPKDIVVTKVLTNALVYENTSVPVDVTVKSSGFSGETIDVSLEHAGRILDRQRVRIEQGTRDYRVHLSYTPESEGTKKFIVRASALEGDLTTENNRMSFFSRVLKGKLRILIVAGSPSSDLSMVRQTLAEQKHFSVLTRTQKRPSGFYEGTLTSSTVDSADCLLLIGFPTEATSGNDLELIRSATEHLKKPVFFVGGKFVDPVKLQSLNPSLPFQILKSMRTEEFVSLEPVESQKGHPLLSGGNGVESWGRLPPIFRTHSSLKAKPEAVVLGVARSQGVVLNEPLFVLRNVSKQKSIALLGYGIWRWRLMAQGDPTTDDLLASFLSDCIRWLTTRDEDRPVKVVTTKEFYAEGEPVEFTGQVYDATARPVDNAELRVRAARGETVFDAILIPIGNGRYESTLHGLPKGEYSFVASASSGGQQLGEDRGRFSIGELNLEFQDTRMNSGLLRQLATRTGGQFFTPGDIEHLNNAIVLLESFSSREVEHKTVIDLWNWAYSLALILSFFSVEWFIRKRSGMI